MSTLLIFLLLVLPILILKGRVKKMASLTMVVMLYLVACGWLNPAIEQWSSDQKAIGSIAEPGSKALIVLLGVGLENREGKSLVPTYALPRLLKTIEVANRCAAEGAACTILISGGATSSSSASEAEVYRDRLAEIAPHLAERIEIESSSRNTWENAKLSASWAAKHGYASANLVTSMLHMPRSQHYFNHFGLTTTPQPAEQALASPALLPSAWNLVIADVFIHEQIGLLRYKIYETMGWNSKEIAKP